MTFLQEMLYIYHKNFLCILKMNKLEMGKRIAKKREAKGLDQSELGRLLDITPSGSAMGIRPNISAW